jgi:4'-phosphopantetheinyl transferase EntD
MPLFYQHNINQSTKLGVWRIEEPESFFLAKVPVNREVSHPHKRLQHLAGRYLLPVLFEDFPLEEIVIADTRKPFLENEKYHFSISHCGDFAAAIVSRRLRVGIDIELIGHRIGKIKHKFLSREEWGFATMGLGAHDLLPSAEQTQYYDLLTLLWSAKEAVYKWYGLGQVDFKSHMRLSGPIDLMEGGFLSLPFLFDKSGSVTLSVEARIMESLILAWVFSS